MVDVLWWCLAFLLRSSDDQEMKYKTIDRAARNNTRSMHFTFVLFRWFRNDMVSRCLGIMRRYSEMPFR